MFVFTACDMLKRSADRFPDKVAVQDQMQEATYADLIAQARSVALFLVSQGVRKGDRVGIFLDNSVQSVAVIFGIMMAGGAFVCFNTKLKSPQVSYICAECDIQLILSNQAHMGMLGEIGTPMADVKSLTVPPNTAGIGLPRVIDRDLACMIFTSGSTGRPKGVVFTHAEVLQCSRIMAELFGNTSGEKTLCTLPFSADYGLTLLYAMVLVGGTLILVNSFFPNEITEALLEHEITAYHGITPIWPILFSSKSVFPDTELPHLRFVTIGGGYPPRPIMDRVVEKFRGKTDIHMLYGLTEAAWSTCLLSHELVEKFGSIGRAIPNVEVYVIDAQGCECAPGKEGILIHRGGVVAKGYWKREEQTHKTFIPCPVGPGPLRNWETAVYSSDLVTVDEEGYIYFKRRVDDLVKVQGYRISLEEVLDQVYSSGMIDLAAVFGVPDPESGQKLVACIIPKDEESFTTGAFKGYLRRNLPPYMVPAELIIMKELPFTQSDKIDVSRLKKSYFQNRLIS